LWTNGSNSQRLGNGQHPPGADQSPICIRVVGRSFFQAGNNRPGIGDAGRVELLFGPCGQRSAALHQLSPNLAEVLADASAAVRREIVFPGEILQDRCGPSERPARVGRVTSMLFGHA
jgi:hypothetical protein